MLSLQKKTVPQGANYVTGQCGTGKWMLIWSLPPGVDDPAMHVVLKDAQVDANWREDMCAIEDVETPVVADGIAVPTGIVM
jgi:hypothetical protein